MKYKLKEHPMLPGSWEIMATSPNGEIYIVLFAGVDAKDRAEEYLAWKRRLQ